VSTDQSAHREGLNAMAMDQSALLELLEMMRTADDNDLMRRLLGTIMQALVDAEATAFVGAEPHQRPRSAPPSAMAPATRRS
jgi:transposase-like protein